MWNGHRDFTGLAGKTEVVPVPEEMDFEMWTGPVPERDYRPALMPLNWRWNYDFSGGQVTDWGAYHIDIVQWALGMDESGPVRLYESRAHEGNFIDCIYSGEPTVAPAEAAHRSITVAHLVNIAMRLGRSTLEWDPAKEQVVGDEKANAMLGREMRKPWSLEGA